MKKILLLTALIFALLAVLAPVSAKKDGQAGKSNIWHKYLMPNLGDEDSWGKVKYNHTGESLDFVLNAHNLEPYTEYIVKSKGNELGSGHSNE